MTEHGHNQRSPERMFELILSIAQADERIRGVYLNGSRANPTVSPDAYQDFDVVFVVKETLPFIHDKRWIEQFGDLAIVQEPDRMDLDLGKAGIDVTKQYAWLMLFKDGNRIDLTLVNCEVSIQHLLSDRLSVVLLDKDQRFPILPTPSDVEFHVKRPSPMEFSACSNEFWWCLNNVGKGLARRELVYAQAMFSEVVRPMLNRLVEWWIGTRTDFSANPGKYGKFYANLLPPPIYKQLLSTYSDCELTSMWDAVFNACQLFENLSDEVAETLGFQRNQTEATNSLAYLKWIYTTTGAQK